MRSLLEQDLLPKKVWSIPRQIIYNGAGRLSFEQARADPPGSNNTCQINLKPASRRS